MAPKNRSLDHLAIGGAKLNKSMMRSVETFQDVDVVKQMRQNPDMWIGPKFKLSRQVRKLSMGKREESGRKLRFSMEDIDFPEALERIFFEIILNAADNVGYSLWGGIIPGTITVKMDSERVTVRNSGANIPVEKNNKGEWIPSVMFGTLFSGTHFDNDISKHKSLTQGGKNGVGAKGTNIFSKVFEVRIRDPCSQREFYQKWSRGKPCSDPTITEITENEEEIRETLIEVSYVADFEYFEMEGYEEEIFGLYSSHCADVSLNCKTIVYFQFKLPGLQEFEEIVMDYRDIREYSKLFGNNLNTVVHYELPEGRDEKEKAKFSKIRGNNEAIVKSIKEYSLPPEVEVMFMDTEGFVSSFVNCIPTSKGGIHVKEALESGYSYICKMANAESEGADVEPKDIKGHVCMVVIVRIHKPVFTSQVKDELKSFGEKQKFSFSIKDKEMEGMLKWNLYDVVCAIKAAKKVKLLKLPRSKKNVRFSAKNVEDANLAGHKTRSVDCKLVITEGISALSYAGNMVDEREGRDTCGIMAFKGKIANARKMSEHKLYENKEYQLFTSVMGLEDCVDYRKQENYSRLRYGKILLLPDADSDGYHILGLFLSLLHRKFPTLCERNIVSFWRTPIVRLFSGKKVLKFYTSQELLEWSVTNDPSKYKKRYFKGLGSSSDEDIVEDCQTPVETGIIYDPHCEQSLNLAFSNESIYSRKVWLETGLVAPKKEDLKMQTVTDFVATSLKIHPIDNIERCIPSMLDGMKQSERKILFYLFDLWGNSGSKYEPGKEKKVSDGVGGASDLTSYKHGPDSLCKVMSGMAQDFVGSNNMNILNPKGQFGTRNRNGEDCAAPRYTAVSPSPFWSYIWKPEDSCLYERAIEEGKKVEYKSFFPILCWVLINGCSGVATAYSSYLPPHNPQDVCFWIILRLSGKSPSEIPVLIPWWKGFKGTVQLIKQTTEDKTFYGATHAAKEKDFRLSDETQLSFVGSEKKRRKRVIEDEDEDEDANDKEEYEGTVADFINKVEDIGEDCPPGSYKMIVRGEYNWVDNSNLQVTEIPLYSINRFCNHLDKLTKSGEIKGYSNNSRKNSVLITIRTNLKDPKDSQKGNGLVNKLCLDRKFSLGNIILLNENNHPVRYDTTSDLLEDFYKKRIRLYDLRRKLVIMQFEKEIDHLRMKIKVVECLVSGKVQYHRRPKSAVKEDLEKLKLSPKYMDGLNLWDLSEEEIKNLNEKCNDKIKELENYQKKSSGDLWTEEIVSFLKMYKNKYPDLKYDKRFDRFGVSGLFL